MNEQNNLIKLLATNPEYRKQYVRYKVIVEHRGIPRNILKALPYEVAVELEELWEKELYAHLKQKRRGKTKNT